MKNKTTILLLLLVMFSCKNKDYTNKELFFNNFLNSTIEETHEVFEIDENLDVESSDFTSVIFPNSITVFNYSIYMICKSYDNTRFKLLSTKVISKSISVFGYENFIENDRGLNTFFMNKEHFYFPYFKQQYPSINNFVNIKTAKIYLLNHKTGYFLTDKNYFNSENNIIKKQKDFKNGFCNGAIIDSESKKIIYFDLIW